MLGVFSCVIIMVTSVRNDGSTVLPKKGQNSLWIIMNQFQITHSPNMQI